ncbi:MAG: hypothetical protein IKG42_02795 [Clostridia bacterium]|nr:hypothetical protein [Clostridia bacterium]
MNRKKKKNKKVILIFILAFVFAFILIMARLISIRINQKQNSNIINTNFQSIKDIIEFYEAEFIKEKKSEDDDYDKDIYVSFKYELFEGSESKENYFKMIIENIVKFDNFKDFRLIDTGKDITIEVKCDKNTSSILEIYYNGDKDYFKKHISKKSLENSLKINTIKVNTDSNILKECISKNWVTKEIDFGTSESKYNKYDIFFDEGYKVRTIQRSLYNIVFTDKFTDSVVEGIRVGDDFDTIKKKLGNSYIEESGLLEYKTQQYYIVFSSNEISIYPNITYETSDFENLVKEYNQSNDIISFMDKLTDLWPDYDYYVYDTGFLDIYYTLKGIRISFNIDGLDGIKVYENYKGKITEENVIYQLDKNLIFESEKNKLADGEFWNPETNKDLMKYSERFYLKALDKTENGNFKNIKILSLDGQYPDNEFDENLEISDYYWITDNLLIYTINNDGIYGYNAETRDKSKVIDVQEQIELQGFDKETKTLKYNNKEITLQY